MHHYTDNRLDKKQTLAGQKKDTDIKWRNAPYYVHKSVLNMDFSLTVERSGQKKY